jgi:hypothetical protein
MAQAAPSSPCASLDRVVFGSRNDAPRRAALPVFGGMDACDVLQEHYLTEEGLVLKFTNVPLYFLNAVASFMEEDDRVLAAQPSRPPRDPLACELTVVLKGAPHLELTKDLLCEALQKTRQEVGRVLELL